MSQLFSCRGIEDFFGYGSKSKDDKSSGTEQEEEEEDDDVSDEELLRRQEQDSKIKGDYEEMSAAGGESQSEMLEEDGEDDPPSGSGFQFTDAKRRSSFVRKSEGWEESRAGKEGEQQEYANDTEKGKLFRLLAQLSIMCHVRYCFF